MKRMYQILLMSMLVMLACSKEENQANPEEVAIEANQNEPLTVEEINAQITQLLEINGTFSWADASDHLLWSAAMRGGNIVTVGYGNESFSEVQNKQLVQLKSSILQSVIDADAKQSGQKTLVYEPKKLNYMTVRINTLAAVKKLRENASIRYIEPDGFAFQDNVYAKSSSNSGCDNASATIPSENYETLSSGARVPWNFYDHNIDKAWSYSTGKGVGVGVIDTGISSNQVYLNSKFDDFYNGRYVQKYGTYVDSWWRWSKKTDGPNDKCGHGTSASATIAAPNNNASQYVGVAYDCNLVSYRATADVFLNDYHERKGVSQAFEELANRSDIKVISISLGYLWSIGSIKDAVKYAHSKGKLIVAAGGTSFSATNWYGIIFPASMSETVAVTGVEETSGYSTCDTCHKGDMDFTFIMERPNNDQQPVIGFNSGESRYFGGSSQSAAGVAGIAALVWAKNPTWNRDQVLQRLKESADLYPNKNSDFGYGNIDALKAVRGY